MYHLSSDDVNCECVAFLFESYCKAFASPLRLSAAAFETSHDLEMLNFYRLETSKLSNEQVLKSCIILKATKSFWFEKIPKFGYVKLCYVTTRPEFTVLHLIWPRFH